MCPFTFKEVVRRNGEDEWVHDEKSNRMENNLTN